MKIFANKSRQGYQIPKSKQTHGSYVDPQESKLYEKK